jgi:hypothetical protein
MQKHFRVLSGKPTERSGQRTGLMTLACATMNCGARKSEPLSLPEEEQVTGQMNMQTVTALLRISG